MNAPRRFLALVSVAVTVVVIPSSAQLIRIEYEGTFVFSTPPFIPLPPQDFGDPMPFHATAVYDSTLHGEAAGGRIFFPGSSAYPTAEENPRNFIHWQSSGVDVKLPLNELWFNSTGDFTFGWSERIPYLYTTIHLDPNTPHDHLPVPPLSFSGGGADFGVVGGFFTYAGGYIRGEVTRLETEFVAVPEPATGGVIAVVGLGVFIGLRRRGSGRQPIPA